MYALNLDKDTGRILSACVVLPGGSYDGMPIVDTLPTGDISEYRYADGEYIHDPLPATAPEEPAPTDQDRMEAQVLYTAMMTDTLLTEG